MNRQLAAAGEAGRQIREARTILVRRLTGASSRSQATALAAEWIAEPPDPLRTMLVHELIESCYCVSADLADQWLTAAQVFAALTLDELKHWQRSALCAVLRASATTGVNFDRRRPAA
jgi:hypothetical protein